MINLKIVSKILGILLFIEALFLLGCSLVSLYYGEDDLHPFLLSVAITAVAGGVLFVTGRNAPTKVSRKDGYLIVTLSWIAFALLGMLPFYLSGYIGTVTDAFFETMSGFTSTGATILDNIEALPHGLLLWRSMTQWFGGLGIVFFTIAVLPIFGSGGMKLFAAETTGPTHSKIHPRIEVSAQWIWSIYLTITLVTALLLIAGDMPVFDSICTALSTAATGGYSVKQNSIAAYNSPYIEYVVLVSMFISGVNFTLLYFSILKGRFTKLFCDVEFRWYVGTATAFTLFIMAALLMTREITVEESFRHAAFQVVSLQTTTGFGTADYMQWPPCTWIVLMIATTTGACAGSTSGAIKCIRVAMLTKSINNQFKRMLHPNAVLSLRINGTVIPQEVKSTLLAFFCVYVAILSVGWIYMLCWGVGFMESFSIVVSSLSNAGPGLGDVGPAFSWSQLPSPAKWGCSILMLAGRLELFSVLLIFSPAFWKHR